MEFCFSNNKVRQRKLYCYCKLTGKKSALFKNVNNSRNNFDPDVKILSLLYCQISVKISIVSLVLTINDRHYTLY